MPWRRHFTAYAGSPVPPRAWRFAELLGEAIRLARTPGHPWTFAFGRALRALPVG